MLQRHGTDNNCMLIEDSPERKVMAWGEDVSFDIVIRLNSTKSLKDRLGIGDS